MNIDKKAIEALLDSLSDSIGTQNAALYKKLVIEKP